MTSLKRLDYSNLETTSILNELYMMVPSEDRDYFTNYLLNERAFRGITIDELVTSVWLKDREKFINAFYQWYLHVVDCRKE